MHDGQIIGMTPVTAPDSYVPDPELVVKARILGPKGLLLFDVHGHLVGVAHKTKEPDTFTFVAPRKMAIWAWGRYMVDETIGPSNIFHGSGKPHELNANDRLQIEIRHDGLFK